MTSPRTIQVPPRGPYRYLPEDHTPVPILFFSSLSFHCIMGLGQTATEEPSDQTSLGIGFLGNAPADG
jgi:hypothetical protein